MFQTTTTNKNNSQHKKLQSRPSQIEKLIKIIENLFRSKTTKLVIYIIPSVLSILTALVKTKVLPIYVETFIGHSVIIQILILLFPFFASSNICKIKTHDKEKKIKISTTVCFIIILTFVANISDKFCLFFSKTLFDYDVLTNTNLFNVDGFSFSKDSFNEVYAEKMNYSLKKLIDYLLIFLEHPLKYLHIIPLSMGSALIGSHEEYIFREYLPFTIQSLISEIKPSLLKVFHHEKVMTSMETDKPKNFYLSFFIIVTCSVCFSLMHLSNTRSKEEIDEIAQTKISLEMNTLSQEANIMYFNHDILSQLFLTLSVGVVLHLIRYSHGLDYSIIAHFMYNALTVLSNGSLVKVVFWKWNGN